MKCLQRCCCLVCALVLLSAVFSIDAHAKDIELPKYYVNHGFNLYNSSYSRLDWASINFTGYNGSQDKIELSDDFVTSEKYSYVFETTYEFGTNDPPIISKGGSATVSMYDGYYGVGIRNTDIGYFGYQRQVDSIRLLVTYGDGTQQYFDNGTYELDGSNISLHFDITVDKDVNKLKFIVRDNFQGTYWFYLTYYLGEINGIDTGFELSVNQQSDESGLLSGILGWVQNIFNSITELPSKLWSAISDGLKSLFVPSEDFIVQYKEDIDSMLENKLGAVYQVMGVTLESWDRISASDEQNTIEFPETTINLPENNEFSFGGYDVKIVPDGFDVLANALKLIGGICVTILFVNGLRKRYDEVMGVEK